MTVSIDPKAYMLGGKAEFSVTNKDTSKKFIFLIQINPNNPKMRFVKLIDDSEDYWKDRQKYMGTIFMEGVNTGNPEFVVTRKADFTNKDTEVMAFAWLFESVIVNDMVLPDNIDFQHTGKCCRCYKKLTTPESVAKGIGPECEKMI
jgi:hypothetical protein